MQRRLIAPLAAIALSVVSSTPLYADGDGHGGKELGIKVETLAKSTKEWNGSSLPHYPIGKPEITILRITVPAGTTLPLHTHPIINAAVILEGNLELSLQDGTKRLFKVGEALIEVVDRVHKGKSIGPEDLVVIVFYAGTKGLPTTVRVNTKGNF